MQNTYTTLFAYSGAMSKQPYASRSQAVFLGKRFN
jgi:hypothetical protein